MKQFTQTVSSTLHEATKIAKGENVKIENVKLTIRELDHWGGTVQTSASVQET